MVWSYVAGKRASADRPSSRVRVYERPDRDGLYMTCAWIRTDAGRPKEEPLPPDATRKKARELADELALERQLTIVRGKARKMVERTTLGKLLDAYHTSEDAAGWSERHERDQQRCKDFWLQELGEKTVVQDLTPTRVEKVAGEAARRNDWSARTEEKYLKYLKAAVRWGWRKAQMYDTNPIRALDLPDVRYDTTDRIYSKREARKLLEPHEQVDWRVTVAANIACDTGRRLSAIRNLTTDDLLMGEDRLLISFRGEHDKTGQGSLVPVSDHTARVVADALDRQMVKKSGLLLPAGRVGYDEHHDKPVGASSLIRMLHQAEDVLGIERVPYRGFHGLKRLHVTLGFEVSGGDAALVGDVTGNVSADLLRRVYRQQDRDRITRQVDAVREELEDPNGDRS